MTTSTYREGQIAFAPQQAEGGTPVADVCRQMGVGDAFECRLDRGED